MTQRSAEKAAASRLVLRIQVEQDGGRTEIMGGAAVQQVVCGDQCLLTHDLNNKLTAIVAECEALSQSRDFPELEKGLHVIREAATNMADAIQRHQCDIAASRLTGIPLP